MAAPPLLLSQIVIAIVGTYASLFGLYKVKSAFSAKPPVPKAAPVAVAAASSGSTSKWGFEPPTLDTFDEWEKNDENWKKWEEVRTCAPCHSYSRVHACACSPRARLHASAQFMSGPLLEKWCDSLE